MQLNLLIYFFIGPIFSRRRNNITPRVCMHGCWWNIMSMNLSLSMLSIVKKLLTTIFDFSSSCVWLVSASLYFYSAHGSRHAESGGKNRMSSYSALPWFRGSKFKYLWNLTLFITMWPSPTLWSDNFTVLCVIWYTVTTAHTWAYLWSHSSCKCPGKTRKPPVETVFICLLVAANVPKQWCYALSAHEKSPQRDLDTFLG